jgi:AcrR family transcriptional regulator/predicted DNA-binding transcriptional regulator AlpA
MNRQIRISALSALAGVSTSTIHFYVKEGLLPKPLKSSKTMAYYSDEHLERLQLIIKLRQENNSVQRIKEILHPARAGSQDSQAGKTTKRREDIIESAIHLFREKGFDDTSISDIIQHASAGRGTFYAYFTNKEELFFECADQVLKEIDRDMQEIQDEPDIPHKGVLRYMYFKSMYPRLGDMINLIRGASVSGLEVFTTKLDQIMQNLIGPVVEDVKTGIEKGFYRNTDPVLTAWMLFGATEYGSYLYYQTDPALRDNLYAEGPDILFNGLERDKQ